MQARKGRASYLGPRSVGHQDPGATSTWLIFRSLAEVGPAAGGDLLGVKGVRRRAVHAEAGPVPGRDRTVVAHRPASDGATAMSPAAPRRVTRSGRRPLDDAFAVVAADLGAMATRAGAHGRPEPPRSSEASFLIARTLSCGPRPMPRCAEGRHAGRGGRDARPSSSPPCWACRTRTLAGRAADVRAVGRRSGRRAGRGDHRSAPPNGSAWCWSATRSPPTTCSYAEAVVGAATVVGGATSHAAIVARSLGVPVVFGVEPELLATPDETEVLLDAVAGQVVVRPDPAERDVALVAGAAARARRAELAAASRTCR